MAEASCSGPSPFKRLVEHQNRDVSHHQDRLVDNSAASGHHGSFRSQPAHPAQGQNDFASFMDGGAPMPGMHHHAAGRLAAHAAALEPLHQQANSPLQHQTTVSPAPGANWAADFARFAGQQQPQGPLGAPPRQYAPAQHSSQLQQGRMAEAFGFPSGQATMQPNGGFSPLYGPTNSGFMEPNAASTQRPAAEADFDEEMSRWMAVHGGGTSNAKAMEDVDAVMEQMARELQLNEDVLDSKGTQDDMAATEQDAHFTDLETPEIGSLSLNQGNEAETESKTDPKARSEVSEAAERLLETVQHEEGDKWKNSLFLSLMRDFRDGKKDIVDNEIRETAEEPNADTERPAN